ncbi:hypothetical protein SDC9_11375 [bioreactor metagenome]|uniref:Spermatogenesis-associated protein 20-like TRX domain-containing protein n=1 Tax=bioreactor metagenome TaxID=1076179 RepID=A0A644TJ23_9ZZZZ|nr:thioredoxin domain-containing protein [Negativicutes bacterium]
MSTKHVNHLANEKSPYLLQHAHNPIDWYPWGEEAFAKAKAEDKPIFFSCGYSTCHWCHVMERESFEDEEVAEVLNRYFVSIKVDREERPDVDHIYMEVCQALTQSGGWPLTIIMTPDKKPFFAGTYFPKASKWGRPGLMDLLDAVQQRWRENRDELIEHSNEIYALLKHEYKPSTDVQLSSELLDIAFQQLEAGFDAKYGGFSGAPKFPTPHNMLFLLRYWRHNGNPKALAMVEKTLTAMRQGGIYDHLGYGFSRYSTDNEWLVPHFEKMLYDNALLCHAYLEAYQCTGNQDFAQVAGEILDYVMRDMTSSEGGFYSAEDADSEGVEGKFYVFTRQQVLDILGEKDGTLVADFYGITSQGNFEHGTSILNFIDRNVEAYAHKIGIDVAELTKLFASCRSKLYAEREKRIHPYKDDKILTAWNALMIAAFAKAARVLNVAVYAEFAERALEFIQSRLVRKDGRLLARYREGEAKHLAYLDDYAFLLWALVELYETVYSPTYIKWALEVSDELKRLFLDDINGGFYFYGSDGEQLLTRPKEIYDGAIPAGNSVAALALLRLANITGNNELQKMAEAVLKAFGGQVKKYPKAYTFYLVALDYQLSARRKIVIAGSNDSEDAWNMIFAVWQNFLPDTEIVFNDRTKADLVEKILPAVSNQQPLDGKATAYICENFACQPPITDVGKLLSALVIE